MQIAWHGKRKRIEMKMPVSGISAGDAQL